MQPIKYGKLALFGVLLMVQSSFSVTYTVKKGGGANFTSIQAAVDQAGIGDEIVIMDTETYSEQVTIDSLKSGLVLRSETPRNLQKPTIKYTDNTNVGPKNQTEALDESKINYDRNGALRILGAASVRIEGIAIDGGGVKPFGYDAVWEGRYALQHGNAAVTLWVAGECIIRECDIKNAYIGINIKDRNEGGVFANPNPADIDPENIIPFSGFARTGNHLIEYNRIHNNSLGFFLESTWDMGSTVRYNLIYDNHHPTAAVAATVKGLTSEGGNQAGGAFMFKDQMLSPLAIYNNTLYHNSVVFLGNWKSGGQHLIFNNIIAEPNEYWGDSKTTFSTSFDMSKAFVNRMHNTVYAAQQQAPTANYTTITNDLKPAQTGGSYNEGALISPFPTSADVRWLETKFLSTDPTDADFLTPDWSDDLVMDYIVDKGWQDAGVKDPDGSRADLGAIPMGGGRPVDLITVRPTIPIELTGTSARVGFNVTPRIGTMTELKIVMFGIVTKLDTADVFGAEYKPITAANISKVSLGSQSIVLGSNLLTVTIPATGDFAFLELVVEGTGSDGQKFTSAVGFLPYRKLEYTMDVFVLDKVGGKELTTVQAGQTVVLNVKAFKGTTPFTNKVDPTDVKLQSRFALLNPTGGTVTDIPGGITGGSANTEVVFTRVPLGGIEYVLVTGRWIDDNKVIAFLGSSEGIRVLAGPPDSIAIQDPSELGAKVDPGTMYTIKVQAFDKYGNTIDQPVPITCESTKPDIGDIAVKEVNTDSTGIARFHAYVTNGDINDTFPIVATLVAKPTATDNSFLWVGLPRDQLRIFYSDTLKYDVTKEISGCSGERVPVTIRAGKYPDSISTERVTQININMGNGLKAFATATSMDAITSTQLVSGQVVIYIQATVKNVSNGTIGVVSTDPTLLGNERSGINFIECYKSVRDGAFFATNGRGAVDKADIWYEEPLEASEVPDSILLCWPSSGTDCRTVYKIAGGIVQDAADLSHLTVTIPTPFAEATTKITGANTDLGTVYWVNPATPEAPSINQTFAMFDSVGPLLMSATLIERLEAGDDTMIITFSEPVDYQKLPGQTLTLIKDGQSLQLTIKDSKPGENQAVVVTVDNSLSASPPLAGDSLMITASGTVSDNGGNKAHPQNRPVVIQISAIAPSLVSAYYRDGNGDGIVDTVRATFNKSIDVNAVLIKVNFLGKDGKEYVAPENMLLVVGSGNTSVDLRIDNLFTLAHLENKTSGTMLVIAQFMNFEGNNQTSITADDKAGPVLMAVEYHFGMMGAESGEADYDTVFAKYSEPLSGVPAVELPIQFNSPTYGVYNIPVFTAATAEPKYAPRRVSSGEFNGYYQFIVSRKDLTPPPEGGAKKDNTVINAKDSAWINTAIAETNAVDALANPQMIPTNKRVAIVTKKPPFFLDVSYGPNPFSPSLAGRPFTINIKAKTKVADQTTFEYSFTVFDKVGNLIYRFPETGMLTVDDKITIQWDGVNDMGRLVGNGTYLGKLFIRYWNTGAPGQVLLHPQTIKIGVKRTQ